MSDFIPYFIDGEGCNFSPDIILNDKLIPEHRYVYLSMTNSQGKVHSITQQSGLPTHTIFDWLFTMAYSPRNKNKLPKGFTLAGFALSYDWEFWLKDIPSSAYMALRKMANLNPKNYPKPSGGWVYHISTNKKTKEKRVTGIELILQDGNRYVIEWIPGKKMTIKKYIVTRSKKYYLALNIYDTFGFFQKSFVKVLGDWNINVSPIVSEGKAGRSGFTWEDYVSGRVQYYSKEEGQAGAILLEKFWQSLNQAYEAAELDMIPQPYQLYGPGALAADFFKTYHAEDDWPLKLENPEEMIHYYWEEFHSIIASSEEWENARQETASNPSPLKLPSASSQELYDSMYFPALWTYAGGRIEAAAMGYISHAYDHDINSAYPHAFTLLPKLPNSPIFTHHISTILPTRPVACFWIKWDFPYGWDWYPFHFRNRRGSITFPRTGMGWVLSPELYAVLDTVGSQYTEIYTMYYWPGTEGTGDANKELLPSQQAEAGRMIKKQIDVRLDLKAKKHPAAGPLKLIPNSGYGKMIQQIGRTLSELGTFNPLVASWCTSYTRSRIWKALASHKDDHTIIAVQTDGILSSVKLDVPISPKLGEWEITECEQVFQLMPGIYKFYSPAKQAWIVKQRGFGGHLPFEELKAHFSHSSEPYHTTYTTFVTRLMSIIQKNKLAGAAYHWVELDKWISMDISTKRQVPDKFTLPQDSLKWFSPYDKGYDFSLSLNTALPYQPSFKAELDDELLTELATMETESLGDEVLYFYAE